MKERIMSADGLAVVKRFEGLRLIAYQDCAGVWTIGYGQTGPEVKQGMAITEAGADALLRGDLAKAAACVKHAVTTEITQCQFDALVDFCFNLGERRLQASTLLRYVNARNFDGAAGQFGMWIYAGGKVQPGLVARRKAEAKMFSAA